MKKTILYIFCTLITVTVACKKDPTGGGAEKVDLADRNLVRAMALIDKAQECYFHTGNGLTMARFYNPFTGVRSGETGSVWMYTSAIEAVNAVMHTLEVQKAKGNTKLYDANFQRYADLMAELYDNAEYYAGTFKLTSFTRNKKEWTVYGVNRGNSKGGATVAGIENVYDDQQWMIRELIEAYKLTGEQKYLTQAEYLTEYTLDGWDCTLNTNGNEEGGITWGPGYVTKHSCSNGPFISPLVWLSEIYKDKADMTTRYYVKADNSRATEQVKKSDYYLTFAKKVYKWQKDNLLREDGVYHDMMGAKGGLGYETINGVEYRKCTPMDKAGGAAWTYNTGSMLSGAADLYRATSDAQYLTDLADMSDDSFNYFAKQGTMKEGFYTYPIDGFSNWFNGVLLRAYVDAAPYNSGNSLYIDSFQKNLDNGYDNYLEDGLMPVNLILGWGTNSDKNQVEAMFTFAYAAEYATIARYLLNK